MQLGTLGYGAVKWDAHGCAAKPCLGVHELGDDALRAWHHGRLSVTILLGSVCAAVYVARYTKMCGGAMHYVAQLGRWGWRHHMKCTGRSA